MDAGALLNLLAANSYDTAVIETEFSPPLEANIQATLAPGPGAVDRIGRLLKPRISLRGKAGTLVLAAPYGAPSAHGWIWRGGLLVSGLVGLGFILGRASKRRAK
jgi:hypothetical protein